MYVSDLPLDITEDEFKELMNKCGLIMYDPRTKKPKLKLYLDENGQPKGDGRCCYIKVDFFAWIHLNDFRSKVGNADMTLKVKFHKSKWT